ncbi:MAG: alpha/beta hydrolase [Candidatus Limnocylindria bacterium]
MQQRRRFHPREARPGPRLREIAGVFGLLGAIGFGGPAAHSDEAFRPDLVIHDDSDGIVPFEVSGKRSAEAIENGTLVVIEGAPHGFNATHAGEFNRALLDFLQT